MKSQDPATQKYLGVNYASVRETLEAMAVASEQHIDARVGRCVKKAGDTALFLDLACRGYDLSNLREVSDPATAEIVKIG